MGKGCGIKLATVKIFAADDVTGWIGSVRQALAVAPIVK
jgi:hypothetical protein